MATKFKKGDIVVVKGVLPNGPVQALAMDEDGVFRYLITWKDADGGILTVQNAYMQAKNDAGATVLDLRWYSTVPSEATVIALTGERRGYLAPASGATLQMHVSDKNTVAAGTYNFDLFVQDSADDWDCLASGVVVVEASISAPPA